MSLDELRLLSGVKSADRREDGNVGVTVARYEDHPDPAGPDEFEALGYTVVKEHTLAYSRGYVLRPGGGG